MYIESSRSFQDSGAIPHPLLCAPNAPRDVGGGGNGKPHPKKKKASKKAAAGGAAKKSK